MTPDETEVSAALCRLELQGITPEGAQAMPADEGHYFTAVEKMYVQRINELSYEIVQRDVQIEMLKLAVITLQGQVAALTPKPPVLKKGWWRP